MVSLRLKIILLIALVSGLCAVLSVGLITARHAQKETIARAATLLSDEARLVAMRVQDNLELPRRDIALLAGTPPIPGLMRAADNAGIDPRDGSYASQWKDRLADIFKALLRTHDAYFQARLVSLQGEGREIVRVERIDGALVRTPEDALQEKASEAYFQRALALQNGEVAVGETSYNRENGVRDPRNIRAVRFYTPIYTPDGEPFAFLIINADQHLLLRDALRRIDPVHNVLIVYGDGDYGVSHASRRFNAIDVGHVDEDRAPPAALALLDTHGTEPWYVVGDELHGVYTVPRGPGARTRAVAWERIDEMVGTARAAVIDSTLVALVFAGLATLVGGVAASRMTDGLRNLAVAVRGHALGRPTLDVPEIPNDETGELIRAFNSLLRRLSTTEMKAQAVLGDLMDAVVVIDERGIIEEFSRAAERLFGYSEQEAIGASVNILMPQVDREAHDAALETYRQTGKRHLIGNRREVLAAHRDGAPFPVDIAVSEIRVGSRRMYSAVIRDASDKRDRKRTDEFISTLNHELRTPLTSVNASLAMLEQSAGEALDTRSARLLELARKGCERLMRIVNDMLDIERVREGRLEFKREVADLRELTRETVDRMRALADEKRLVLSLELDAAPCPATVDPLRFSQALSNLLSNALRHSPVGAKVEVSARRTAGRGLRVTVRDHGPGIPEAFRDKVFERFAQAENHGGGSGLGLSIARSLIRAFGGELSFDSREGAGAAFHIDLPLHGGRVPDKESSVDHARTVS
ncbi:ATP-binding protein [Rhodovulum sp. DZ06]|uniref:sensor histidine kinase n=1 Tax=Rhodovulum sp. DZ06 TaxID=3425126 RepID=UPI003D352AA4